ncbi:MAG: PAS domain S-box protein [Verrucomicrobia bacterium]|nr:PAS domain S-box protein [Verrucomicrobiota bacterium]
MSKELRVLILEDVPADVVLINHELRRGGLVFRSKRVETKDAFVHELRHSPPDVILSDHGLPGFDGFTALAIAQNECPDTPFIFVTTSLGEEVAIETLKCGATDYVLKDRLATSLIPAVRQALREADERAKRKQAEHSLRESEERFRLLIEGVKDYALCMLDPQGGVMSWNAGAEWIMGYAAAEIVGKSYACFFTPEDVRRGKPEQILTRAAEEGRHAEEGQRQRKGGARFFAHVIVTALRDREGRLRGFAHVTRDESERKQAEEELQRSETRYRRLVEVCPDALLVQSNDRIILVNEAGLRLWGATQADQLSGKPLQELFAPEQWPALQDRMQRLRQEGTTVFLRRARQARQTHAPSAFHETLLVRLDGSRVAAAVAVAPLTFQHQSGIMVIAHEVTEHQKAVAGMRDSEARRTAILETALDAIFFIDHRGTFQEWNPAAERIFGYRRDEALGRGMDELIVPPSLQETYRHGLADYLVTGVGSLLGRPIELTAMRAGGAEFPAELAITRVPQSDPPAFTCFVRDITQRKQAEDELRESEQRMRAILESAVEGIITIDEQGTIESLNPEASRIFGYEPHELVGQNVNRLMPSPDREQHDEYLARYRRTGEARIIGIGREVTGLRKNGATFPMELAISEVRLNGRRLFTGFVRDITERKKALEDLRRSDERFRILVEGVVDYGIYLLDPAGHVASWNSGAERIEGYREDEVLGRPFAIFFPEEDRQRGQPEQEMQVAATEGRIAVEGWRLRKDGSKFWSFGVLTALRDPNGQLYGYSKVIRDLSKQRQAQEQIHRLNAELEQRVEDRTAQLQTVNKELEAFSYSVSHDLRAPLRHIDGFVDILQRNAGPSLNEENRALLQTISTSAKRMGKLIDDLLAFARIGRGELNKTPFSLAQLVVAVQHDLRPETQGRAIEWAVASDLPEAFGDPVLLRQVLINLLSNALKYTRPRPAARIELGWTNTPDELVVHVRDNGIGFDMKYADKLFGVFQRLHRADEFEGTGIGLANVRRIVQRHGGRVWAESAIDHGATFYFSLPNPPPEKGSYESTPHHPRRR